MTMDWESWLREGDFPSSEPGISNGTPADTSKAVLLGLPVATAAPSDGSIDFVPEETLPEVGDFSYPDIDPAVATQVAEIEAEPFTTDLGEEPAEEQIEEFAEELALEDDGEQQTLPPSEQTPEERMTSDADEAGTEEAEAEAEETISPFVSVEDENDQLNTEPPALQAVQDEELPPSAAEPKAETQEASYDLFEAEEEERPVSVFTIPPQPLYPLPVSPAEPEKKIFAVEPRIEAKREPISKPISKPINSRTPVILILAVLTVVAVLFLFPRESFDELFTKGNQAYGLQKYEEALSYFEKAAAKSPPRIEALRGKALALEALNRKGEAIDAWYGCLQITPESPEVHARIGELLYNLGSLDKSIRSYQESLGLDPDNADTLFRLGLAYEDKGDIEQAAEAFAKAAGIDPSQKDIVEAKKRTGEELKTREEERLRQQTMAEEQIIMGIASLVGREYEDAEAHFQRALDLTPDDEKAMLGIAESKAGRGDTDGAKKAYIRLIDVYPDNVKAMEGLASLESSVKGDSAVIPGQEQRAEEEKEKLAIVSDDTDAGSAAVTVQPGKSSSGVLEVAPSGDTVVPSSKSIVQKKPDKQEKTTTPPVKERPKTDKDRPKTDVKKAADVAEGSRGDKVKEAPVDDTKVPKVAPPAPKREERVSVAKSLEASRSMNLSKEYSKAVDRASEALRGGESPEALSNLGFAHIGMGNYPAAFTAYWRRLLLSSKIRYPYLEPPAFLSAPFETGRWKEIPAADSRNVPLSTSTESLFIFPGSGGNAIARVLTGKEYLFEALRINPADSDVYLNIVLSYIQMQSQRVETAGIITPSTERENENALYIALLGHALHACGEEGRAADFLNAASERATGEILRFVRSLESLNSPENGR
ncbi:MAG: tetratricopeptide repeat protein [Aminobacteriaceae bacterium]